MRAAAERGAEAYLRRIGRSEAGAEVVRVTYDKLHNAAFDGDPDSPAMRRAVAAAKHCGLWNDEPVTGWAVSCDARLFATEHPGMPVLTFGPGHIGHAHSDQEQLSIAGTGPGRAVSGGLSHPRPGRGGAPAGLTAPCCLATFELTAPDCSVTVPSIIIPCSSFPLRASGDVSFYSRRVPC